MASRSDSALREAPTVLSVSELNRQAKSLLELHLNQIWVEGELSNLSQPSSGHWYFTLKDAQAQVRCAMFRNRNALVRTRIKSGDHVKLRARVSLYEARGDYQLIAEHLEPAGAGFLQQQFEQLKSALAKEGLFDQSHKKALPTFTQKLAVISSPTGAALHDILHVLKRRNPAIEVIVIPSVVQGRDAPASLLKALQAAERLDDVDAIIIGRGGGSIEDLWAFNDEVLARAIFACHTPIISAVGHEIDFSISDFVADMRAPTPSAAAELVSIDQAAITHRLQNYAHRLNLSMAKRINLYKNDTINLSKRLKHPGDRLQQWQQRTDYCEARLHDAIEKCILHNWQRFQLTSKTLSTCAPNQAIAGASTKVKQLRDRLQQSTKNLIDKKRLSLAKTSSELHIVSPLATLERGYTISRSHKGTILRSVNELAIGQNITLTFYDGEASTNITSVPPDTVT